MSCFLVLMLLMLLCVADGSVEPKSADLASKFKSEKLWTDSDLEQTLNTYLDEAKKNPTDKIIEVLIEHIDYDIYGGRPGKMIGVEKQYAVVGVLSEIGLSSVPALVNALKTTDPEDKKNNGDQKQGLAIFCLRKIYDRGGFGKELAIQRLNLEIKKTKGNERRLLEKAMNSLLEEP